MSLDIHLEYCDDKGERLRKIAGLGKPFAISIVPVLLLPEHDVFKNGVYPSDYYYTKKIVETLRELSKNPNVVFGQQGFLHYCSECYKKFMRHGGREKNSWPDPWHENYCLYQSRKSIEEQTRFMEQGKKIIEQKLGISPVLYAPPNHLFDRSTLVAAEELGFKFLADRNIAGISPYKVGNITIIPESKLGEKNAGEFFYTHYDRMKEDLNKYLRIIKNSIPLNKIVLRKVSFSNISTNEKLKLDSKRERDLERESKSKN